ncbi:MULTISPECIES: efflux RND transporter periplasmic adaptor subunit [unclassified Methylobacterium]|uniref:efflux RND transporter periplasmic adaptor subunit n=1 Tax=unclassified Methylobacterium TaxID=2615210 RepID=UPI0008EF8814|nr:MULTISPECIES: efflux RND transporter periplasmic adaptor subunit [unclassified Methylobacterium]SFU94435.1 membrane fusion protein, cobalt-zinc-cadmium efflux system [Methylobacterium sp. UNCCL125]
MLKEAETDMPGTGDAEIVDRSGLREYENTGGSGTVEAPIGSASSTPASTQFGRRSRWVLVVCLAALGLAGWWYRDAVRPYVEPLLQTVGLAPAAPAVAPTTPAASEQPTEDNVVRLDADGQGRLGLAFEQSETRRIILPVRTPGMVAFDERRVTRLKPRTSGRVLSLSVQPGDRVKAGQTLATLDASGVLDARNGLAAAQASLGEAQATEKVAETNLKRGSDLVKLGGVAQAEVDRRQVDLAKAHAATLSAKSQVDLYRAQYERLAPAPGEAPGTSGIVSPINGVVTMAGITLGEVVDTNRDAFTVADPSQIQVLANLYGHDIATVKAGDRATIEAPVTAHPRFEGRVRSVNAAIDPTTNTAPARIEIANPDGTLRANMFVSVEIAADLGREGVTVPAGAIQQTEGGPIAFVRTADDRFEKRDLKLGVQRADWVEVKSGIQVGETVATQGSFGLKAILMRALLGSTD